MMLDLVQNSPPKVKIPTPIIVVEKNIFYRRIGPFPLRKFLPTWYISSTNKQLENMSIDPTFVELTADVLKIFL